MKATTKKKPTTLKVIGYILIATIILSNTPPAQYFLLPHYSYQNKDGSFQYSEEPGKGMNFQTGLIQFEGWKQQHPNNPNHTLYRKSHIKPWAFWEWWQYIANSERFDIQILPK